MSASAYYKRLIYTERVRGANSEAENTTPTAYDDLINSYSPYYKGLIKDQAFLTIPNRESRSSSPYYKGLTDQSLLTIPNHESRSSWADNYQPADLENFKKSIDKAIKLQQKVN